MAKRIITISREFGSGGRFIGEEVAKKLVIMIKMLLMNCRKVRFIARIYSGKCRIIRKRVVCICICRDITGSLWRIWYMRRREKVILELADGLLA